MNDSSNSDDFKFSLSIIAMALLPFVLIGLLIGSLL